MRSKRPGDQSGTREVTPAATPRIHPQRRNFCSHSVQAERVRRSVAARALSGGSVAPDAAPTPEGKGYTETDHVRRYYRTAKI